ncbi:MAG: AraC family transcriptional regulator ligand-binding domain-containing protein [Pseudomonadota bacterium]
MDGQLYTRTEPVLLPLYPRLILSTLRELGYEEQQIFAGLDLQANQLQDENYRLTIEQHEQFILRALDLTGDPHLAIRLNQRRGAETGNLALLAVANSGQIAKALDLITRYFKIVTRVFSIRSFTATDEQAVMHIDVHVEHELVIYFAISAFVLFLDRFFLDALNQAHLVRRVALPVPPPAGFEVVNAQFPFEMAFDQSAANVSFDRELLDQPMQQADPQTVRLLLEMTERQLAEADAETSLVGAVKLLLIEQIAAPPKLNEAARHLGLSPRTLRRKLAAADTTYQTLLDGIRLKMALRLLKETKSPLAAIAYELGFSTASDFGRAFRKWTGHSPSTLRNR